MERLDSFAADICYPLSTKAEAVIRGDGVSAAADAATMLRGDET
jgi:hypothetical protein